MPWSAAVGAIVGAVATDALSDDSPGQPSSVAQSQALLANIAKEEWDLYQKEGVPLLQELAGMRKPFSAAEEEARAASETKSAFSTARQSLERSLGRTRNPGDEGFGALLAPSYMDEASAVSKAITDARHASEDRDWARTVQTIGAYQRLPQDASAAATRSGTIGISSADAAARAAAARANAVSQGAYSGSVIGANAARWLNRPGGTQTPGSTDAAVLAGYNDDYYGYRPDLYGENYQGPAAYGAMMGETQFRHGGRIRGPGSGTSDSVPAIVDGRKQIKVSNGEFIIPDDVVRVKGQEFFDNLLKKYHRPVADREDRMANGGPLRRRGLPADVEDAIFVSLPRQAISRQRR